VQRHEAPKDFEIRLLDRNPVASVARDHAAIAQRAAERAAHEWMQHAEQINTDQTLLEQAASVINRLHSPVIGRQTSIA